MYPVNPPFWIGLSYLTYEPAPDQVALVYAVSDKLKYTVGTRSDGRLRLLDLKCGRMSGIESRLRILY